MVLIAQLTVYAFIIFMLILEKNSVIYTEVILHD